MAHQLARVALVLCGCSAPRPAPAPKPAPPVALPATPAAVRATDLTIALAATEHADGATERVATFTTATPLVGSEVTVFDLHLRQLSSGRIERVGERYRLTLPAAPDWHRTGDWRMIDIAILSPPQPNAHVAPMTGLEELQSVAWRRHLISLISLDTGIDLDNDGKTDINFGFGCAGPQPLCHEFFTYAGLHDAAGWTVSPVCAGDDGPCVVPPARPQTSPKD